MLSVQQQRRQLAPHWAAARDFWLKEARSGDSELRAVHVGLARTAHHRYLQLKRVTPIR